MKNWNEFALEIPEVSGKATSLTMTCLDFEISTKPASPRPQPENRQRTMDGKSPIPTRPPATGFPGSPGEGPPTFPFPQPQAEKTGNTS